MRRCIKILALLCAILLVLLTACGNKELEKQVDEMNAKLKILEQDKKELEETISELNSETEKFPNIKRIVEKEKNNIFKSINLFIASLDNAHDLLDYTYDFEYEKLNHRYSLIIYKGDCPYGFCKLYDNVTNEVKKIDIPNSDNNCFTTAKILNKNSKQIVFSSDRKDGCTNIYIPNENPKEIIFFSNGKTDTGAGKFRRFSIKYVYNIDTEEICIIHTPLHEIVYHNLELGSYTNEMEFDEVIVDEKSFSINFVENNNTHGMGAFNFPTIYMSTEKPENKRGYISFIFQNVLLQEDTVPKFDKLKQLEQIKDVEVSAYDDSLEIKGTKVCIYLNDGVEYYGDFLRKNDNAFYPSIYINFKK